MKIYDIKTLENINKNKGPKMSAEWDEKRRREQRDRRKEYYAK